jgi:amino acid transporter
MNKDLIEMTRITNDSPKGDRKIGLLGATAIGIGGMVGGGIFAVLGTAVGKHTT